MKPVGSGNMYGRDGILAHSFLLGEAGASNGCISVKDYDKFLKAYEDGKFNQIIVLRSADEPVPALVANAQPRARKLPAAILGAPVEPKKRAETAVAAHIVGNESIGRTLTRDETTLRLIAQHRDKLGAIVSLGASAARPRRRSRIAAMPSARCDRAHPAG